MNNNNEPHIWTPVYTIGRAVTVIRDYGTDGVILFNFYWNGAEAATHGDRWEDQELKASVNKYLDAFTPMQQDKEQRMAHFMYSYDSKAFKRISDPKWIEGIST